MGIILINFDPFVMLGVLLVFFLINISNWIELQPLHSYQVTNHQPHVSILIPMRNEETNIDTCLQSMVRQTYKQLEIIILNDRSTDNTLAKLEQWQQQYPILQIKNGSNIPNGWNGKHWACHQLSQYATGEIFLFFDADVTLSPYAVQYLVNAMTEMRADFISAYPRQIVKSVGEKLTVPFLCWSLFTFFPLALAKRIKSPKFATAVGQCLMFQRDAYHQVGGFERVKDTLIDDFALAKNISRAKLTGRVVLGNPYIQCRMYSSFKTGHDGMSRSMFAAFENNVVSFVICFTLLSILVFDPLLHILNMIFFTENVIIADFYIYFLLVGLIGLQFFLTCKKFDLPVYLSFIYPFLYCVFLTIAIRSVWKTKRNIHTWKGSYAYANDGVVSKI